MQPDSFFHGEGLALPVLTLWGFARASLLRAARTDEARRVAGGHSFAFFQQEVVEAPDGENLGVPVVEGRPFREGEFARREAFHAGSTTMSGLTDPRCRARLRHLRQR